MSTTASSPVDVMSRLRSETRAAHERTEAVPFSQAMLTEVLPRDRFVGQLRAYAVVHESLETALAASTDPAVQSVWREDLGKLPLLQRDLRYFADDPCPLEMEAMQAARSFATEIERIARERPLALLGYLYVLEGSTLGASILRQHIAEMYDLEGTDGLAYYTPYGKDVMGHWREFKARMSAAVTDSGDQDVVVEAASDAFGRIGTILTALSKDLPDT